MRFISLVVATRGVFAFLLAYRERPGRHGRQSRMVCQLESWRWRARPGRHGRRMVLELRWRAPYSAPAAVGDSEALRPGGARHDLCLSLWRAPPRNRADFTTRNTQHTRCGTTGTKIPEPDAPAAAPRPPRPASRHCFWIVRERNRAHGMAPSCLIKLYICYISVYAHTTQPNASPFKYWMRGTWRAVS